MAPAGDATGDLVTALVESVPQEHFLPPLARILLAVLALAGLAIAAGTPISRRLHRHRAVAALAAGGWLAVIAGVAIGPGGLDLVDDGIVAAVRPLVIVALGWVGLIVGLQARRRLLAAVPRVAWRWTSLDAAASIVAGLLVAAALLWAIDRREPLPLGGAILAASVLVAANLGWAPETRSLRVELSDRTRRVAVLASAAAGLSSIAAVILSGVVALPLDAGGAVEVELIAPRTLLLVATALVAGIGTRFLLAQVERSSPQMLVVLVGLVCLVAGIADATGISPLLSGLLAGAVLANLPGAPLRNLEDVIRRGEHAGAILLQATAGTLLDVRLGGAILVVAVVLAASRATTKPPIMRRVLVGAGEELPSRTPLRLAGIRQAPIAVAIAVAAVLADDSFASRATLTAVVLAGLLSSLLPPLRSWWLRRRVGADRLVGAAA